MLEDYQILILCSMVAGYILLRAVEGVIKSIKGMRHDKYAKEYDEFVDAHQKAQDEILNKDVRGLEKNE